jgi:hypothetical protein
MRFEVATLEGSWETLNGDLSLNGVRLSNISPYRFAPLTTLQIQLPDELQKRRLSVRIKRYFIAADQIEAVAVFEGLEFDDELAIARTIDLSLQG